MSNIPGLILTWFAGSNQSTNSAMKTLALLHQYIDFDSRTEPIASRNSSKYHFQFENALSGKILSYSSFSKKPSLDDLRQHVKHLISPLCKSFSIFYFQENEYNVCFRPQRLNNFSRLDDNIIKIFPGSMLSDEEATGYLNTLIKENNSELVKRVLCDGPTLIQKNSDSFTSCMHL